jgi:hypothetical protein
MKNLAIDFDTRLGTLSLHNEVRFAFKAFEAIYVVVLALNAVELRLLAGKLGALASAANACLAPVVVCFSSLRLCFLERRFHLGKQFWKLKPSQKIFLNAFKNCFGGFSFQAPNQQSDSGQSYCPEIPFLQYINYSHSASLQGLVVGSVGVPAPAGRFSNSITHCEVSK